MPMNPDNLHFLTQPNFVSLEGYIVARIFVEGLRRSGASPTRESIIDAIESLSRLDIGLGVPVSFSSTDHQASHAVWTTMYREGRFLPSEWQELKEALGPRLLTDTKPQLIPQ